ncbi:hypothetical protein [Epilithonimonas arachidiradicis]|uniref:YD repeat-containing protein n=1 Tax=Epilithonimonas arachidiradicis TaxID=1617282 RepID=A0A420DC47_9FLAO|nr:hypothetical protein [Epilithonimonas arachidiradicis]RKE89069.1 hypothetical protein BXY58_1209 [Epilithonimonas arachidiradicis]GGG52797.1 hypothetical protein GCM10007332_13090 [Epilithonimonas arachidiradicis]
MLNYISLLLISFLVISCSGDIEEQKLLRFSDENKKYEFEIIEKDFNEKDSLNFEKKYYKILDSQYRLINENNLQFSFYNSHNKLSEIKSVYRRGGKTNILIYKYLYDKKQNLKLITYQFNDVDTIQIFKYNEMNQLIQKDYPFRKSLIKYKYDKDKISEITEFENGEISKYSKFSYDDKGNRSIEDWVFNENQRMRTYFKYNSKNKLISKRDTSFTNSGHPNEYVEFLDKYFYNKNDSLIEKRQYGRILSEKKFEYRGKTTYDYKQLR